MDEKSREQTIEKLMKERQAKRTGAKVFCVACGASKRTLHKWHNSYLCKDCFKTATEIGDDRFIKSLQGIDPWFEELKKTDPVLREYFKGET